MNIQKIGIGLSGLMVGFVAQAANVSTISHNATVDDVLTSDWVNQINALMNEDHGGSLELGSLSSGSTPYIDFKNSTSDDFDMRFLLRENDLMSVDGGTLQVSDGGSSPGDQLFKVGDDTFFTDVDQGNLLGLYGVGNPDRGGLRLGSDGSFIFGDNGNIGIGTRSPGSKLEVAGKIEADSYCDRNGQNCKTAAEMGGGADNLGDHKATKHLDMNSKNLNNVDGVVFKEGGGFNMYDTSWIRTTGDKNFFHNQGIMRTDGELHVGGNGARFRVQTNGNVGIGTTSPGRKLEVAGSLGLTGTSNSIYLKDTSGTVKNDYMIHLNDNKLYFMHDANDNGSWSDDGTDDRIIFDTDGNGVSMGIGADPSGHLVTGPALVIGDSDTGLKQRGDGQLSIYTNNGERVRVQSNGYVGIGTTNPGNKLEVAGKIEADSYCDRNGQNCKTAAQMGGSQVYMAKGCAACPQGAVRHQNYGSGNKMVDKCSNVAGKSWVAGYTNIPVCSVRGNAMDNRVLDPWGFSKNFASSEDRDVFFEISY